MIIAGHNFEETRTGRRCTSMAVDRVGVCNAAWLHVRTVTAYDVDSKTPGFAHSGNLSTYEYKQILDEVAAEEGRLWAAIMEVAGGSR